MLGVFAEFETNPRRERQAECFVATKFRGVYLGRRPKIDLAKTRKKLAEGATPTDIAMELGVLRGTVYKTKHQMEEPA